MIYHDIQNTILNEIKLQQRKMFTTIHSFSYFLENIGKLSKCD